MHPSRAAAVSALVEAITEGDVHEVLQLVARTPDLVIGPLGGPFKTRSALHIAADWPGFLPNGPRIVRVLLEGGADPNFRHPGDETPLHWAASSDDADVAAALLGGGADIEAPEGSIGSPLENAIGYGCWHVACLLAARGARVDKLWHAAALGRLDQLEQLLAAGPSSAEVSRAFWHACSAGQRRTAERLLASGAEPELDARLRRWHPAGRCSPARYATRESDRVAAAAGRRVGKAGVTDALSWLGARQQRWAG